MKQNMQDLTEGPLGKKILIFSVPLMLSNLLQVLFNMADIAVIGQFAGSLSLVAAFAMRAGWTLRGVEPAVGLVLLLGGLWTLNFPFSVDTFVPVASFLGIFLAFYLLATAFEMYRRSAGRPGMQVAVAAGVILVSFANLFGLMGASGMLVLSALELYLAGWGFVYACISLSVDAPRAELA